MNLDHVLLPKLTPEEELLRWPDQRDKVAGRPRDLKYGRVWRAFRYFRMQAAKQDDPGLFWYPIYTNMTQVTAKRVLKDLEGKLYPVLPPEELPDFGTWEFFIHREDSNGGIKAYIIYCHWDAPGREEPEEMRLSWRKSPKMYQEFVLSGSKNMQEKYMKRLIARNVIPSLWKDREVYVPAGDPRRELVKSDSGVPVVPSQVSPLDEGIAE